MRRKQRILAGQAPRVIGELHHVDEVTCAVRPRHCDVTDGAAVEATRRDAVDDDDDDKRQRQLESSAGGPSCRYPS